MQKKTKLMLLFIFITGTIVAQPYGTAVGLRLGANTAHISPGFTAKHFLKEDQAVEVLVGINNGIGICGLYEWHKDIATVPNLQWFAGGGGYAVFRYNTSYVGVAGIAGLEYSFTEVPINITLDWKPELNIVSSVGFESSGIGLSVRYCFGSAR
jgi:hypothetical protein